MNVEDLVKENLEHAAKKLEILDEEKLNLSLDDYVSKEVRQALTDGVAAMLDKQQKALIKRRNDDGEGVSTGAQIREIVQEKVDRREHESSNQRKKRKVANEIDGDDEENDVVEVVAKQNKNRPTKSQGKASIPIKRKLVQDPSDDDEEIESIPRGRGVRQNNRTVNYKQHDNSNSSNESDAADSINDDDDDEKEQKGVKIPMKRTTRTQSKKPTIPKRTRKKLSSFKDDSDEERFGGSYGVDDDWGTANTNTEK